MDHYFGVDVSLAKLDIGSEGGCNTIANTKVGVSAYLKTIEKGSIIAVESTGGLGLLFANAAFKAGMKVYLVQPGKVKKFRESSPARGKTDRLDAMAICQYIQAHHLRLHPFSPLPPFEAKLRKLSRTRGALVDKVASLRNQLRSLGDPEKQIQRSLKGLLDRISNLDVQIAEMLKQDPDVKRLLTIPGVGKNMVSAILPALRAIKFHSKYAMDSYLGIDLIPNDSGPRKGRKRMSKQGDKYARRMLFMSGLAATKSKAWNPYYSSLLADKKLQKIQAVNALGRKILHTVYGVYTTKTEFDPAKLTPGQTAPKAN